jgi:hypothetical protein
MSNYNEYTHIYGSNHYGNLQPHLCEPELFLSSWQGTHPGYGYRSHPGYGYRSHPGYGYRSHPGYGYRSHPGYGYRSHPGYGYRSHPGYGYRSHPGYGYRSQHGYVISSGHGQYPAPLQQVVVENPSEPVQVEEVSFLKPHDPLPRDALNSISHIGTCEQEVKFSDIENQLIRLIDDDSD